MSDRTWITVFFPTPLIFRYHLPLNAALNCDWLQSLTWPHPWVPLVERTQGESADWRGPFKNQKFKSSKVQNYAPIKKRFLRGVRCTHVYYTDKSSIFLHRRHPSTNLVLISRVLKLEYIEIQLGRVEILSNSSLFNISFNSSGHHSSSKYVIVFIKSKSPFILVSSTVETQYFSFHCDVAEAETTQPNRETASRVLYRIF